MASIDDVFGGLINQHKNRGLGSGQLDAVILQIREDAGNKRGPGKYVLPGVRDVRVSKGGGALPSLHVNGREVGYLHRGSDMMARALGGLGTCDVEVRGHYENTAFYIDFIDRREMPIRPAAAAPGQPAAPDRLDLMSAEQCDDMAQDLMARAQALRAMAASRQPVVERPAEPTATAPPPRSTSIQRDAEGGMKIGGISIPVRRNQ